MSQARIPQRLADVILGELYYGKNPYVTEFQLASYQRSLEDLIKNNIIPFEGRDYEALALVYFNQAKFDKFESLLRDVIKIYEYEPALLSLCIGLLTLEEMKGTYETARIVDYYYSHKFIFHSDKKLSFNRRAEWMRSERSYNLKKFMDSSLTIYQDYSVLIWHGELSFKITLDYLNDMKWDLPFLILQEISLRITNRKAKDFEISILKEYYTDNITASILKNSSPIAI